MASFFNFQSNETRWCLCHFVFVTRIGDGCWKQSDDSGLSHQYAGTETAAAALRQLREERRTVTAGSRWMHRRDYLQSDLTNHPHCLIFQPDRTIFTWTWQLGGDLWIDLCRKRGVWDGNKWDALNEMYFNIQVLMETNLSHYLSWRNMSAVTCIIIKYTCIMDFIWQSTTYNIDLYWI